MADDISTVVFSGQLLKQNRRGRWQKRVFRFDGLLLLCLSPKRQKLPDNVTMLTFDPSRHLADGSQTGAEFADALRRFYPTTPPMPALTNPLIASYDEFSSDVIYTKYYHMPKWIVPTSTITSIRTLVPFPPKDPSSTIARTFVIQTIDRDYVLRAPTAELFNRWTFLLSRMSANGGDHGVVDEGRRQILEAEDERMQDEEDGNEDEDEDDAGDAAVGMASRNYRGQQSGRSYDDMSSQMQQSAQFGNDGNSKNMYPQQNGSFSQPLSPYQDAHMRNQPPYPNQEAYMTNQPFSQPPFDQFQPQPSANQYFPQNYPSQPNQKPSVDVTHDAIPRLDEWHKSITELIARDGASRESMLTISTNNDTNVDGDKAPIIERGKARMSFLGPAITPPLSNAPPEARGGPAPMGMRAAGVTAISTARQLPFNQRMNPPTGTAPSPSGSSAPPSQISSRPMLRPQPQQQPPQQQQQQQQQFRHEQQRIYLPRPREIPHRELSHAATSCIRLIRRLQGFASDEPSARPENPPGRAYILQYACESIPHQLARIRVRFSERTVEVKDALKEHAGGGPTGYESVVQGLDRVLERVVGIERVWRDGVVRVLSGNADVVGAWQNVLNTQICALVVDVMQDVRRTYC
ncbi:hypothetical protein HDU78_006433 [Chytriomyces hyalinus]|nr:hypothetical protein HDU78_006433 [Chytriomyces hyalinus]